MCSQQKLHQVQQGEHPAEQPVRLALLQVARRVLQPVELQPVEQPQVALPQVEPPQPER